MKTVTESLSVDTFGLKEYAGRISNVNKRIVNLDFRLKGLYSKVGLRDLWNLASADRFTCYSGNLRACQTYLTKTASDFEKTERDLGKEDPLSFNGSLLEDIKEAVYNVGVAIKKAAENVKSTTINAINYVIDSYNSHGWVYDLVEYGKAVITCVKGVKKVVEGVGSLIGSGGLSLPLSVMLVLSGFNDIYNSVNDIRYVANDDYEKVGDNLLRDGMAYIGGEFGAKVGSREVGEFVGNIAYYGIDIYTSMAAFKSAKKDIPKVDTKVLASEVKDIARTDVSEYLWMDIKSLKSKSIIVGAAYTEVTTVKNNVYNYYKAGSKMYGVLKGTYGIGKSYKDIFIDHKLVSEKDDVDVPIGGIATAIGPIAETVKTIVSPAIQKKADELIPMINKGLLELKN